MSELKPCPFCGGEAKAYHNISNEWWGVMCSTEKCAANAAYLIFDSESEAIEAWNTRHERTCHTVKGSRKYVLSDGTELFEDGCSECNGYLSDGDNYCPNCGAKVVE